MKNIFTKISLALIISTILCTSFAFASDFTPSIIPKPDTLPGPTINEQTQTAENNVFTSEVLPRIALGLTGFVGAAALVMLIVSGIRFATVYGNEEAVDKAKSQIIYSLVGFGIAMLAFTIVSIIVNFDFGEKNTTKPVPAATTAPTPAP